MGYEGCGKRGLSAQCAPHCTASLPLPINGPSLIVLDVPTRLHAVVDLEVRKMDWRNVWLWTSGHECKVMPRSSATAL